jgi:4-amino-4-deoxy-L-arabinose transferase-like glycosyltransferase
MLTFYQNTLIKVTEKQLVFLWLIVCFVALTYKLGGVPPYHSDENYYVESVRNMVESGDYLTPIYRDEKRFAKPVLYYWMMSVSYKVFGVSLISARLTSALFGSLAIGLLYLLSRQLFEGRVALYSVLILPASYMHFHISRWATTDIAMNFFIILALYYFVRFYKSDFTKKKEAYLFYLAMAFGFMTKGPPAVIIPGAIAIVFLLATRRLLSEMLIKQGLVILFLVIFPWFAAMFFLHGEEFKNHIFEAEIKNRMVHNTPFSLYYFGVLFRYYLPWTFFFIAAIIQQFGLNNCSSTTFCLSEYLRQAPKKIKAGVGLLFAKENESDLFCYIWIVVCLVLFTILRIEHSRYMLPASPAVAVLVAKYFVDMKKDGLNCSKTPFILVGVTLVLAGVLSGLVLYVLGTIYHVPLQFYLLPIVTFVAGISVFMFVKNRQYEKHVFVISVSLVFVFSFLSGEVLPHINRYPMQNFAERILSDKISDPIAVYRLGNQRARLGVLTGQKSYNLSQPAQIHNFIDTNKKVLIVMREHDWQESFSDSSFRIVAEDVAWLKERIDLNSLQKLLGKVESDGVSSLTEKIYLLTNR